MADLVLNFNLESSAVGYLTSAVQFGFILGTFLFALLTITDRFSPSKVFFFSAIIGALFNLFIVWAGNGYLSLLCLRFLTGFFLAGIYPVGMKIASDYYEKGLGKSLGFLVGALVVGTAFPHLLKGYSGNLPWEQVIYATSGLAVLGGLLIILFVPNGPYRKPALRLDFSMIYKVFKDPKFKSASFGYFGHMWELYAFWAFVPISLNGYASLHSSIYINIPLMSFIVIAIGGLACVISGYLSQTFGAKRIATIALGLSCFCCLLSPLTLIMDSEILFFGYLIFWGMVVIADSPLFSTLVAQNAISESKGTALTIVNSIGFAITILSIQLLTFLKGRVDIQYLFVILALGPIIGLKALFKKQ